jgi:CheY-like chemotaxis protein
MQIKTQTMGIARDHSVKAGSDIYSGGASAGLRILLVDDEPNVRESIALVLGLDGHKVTERESGVSALQELEHNSYDLVVTDFRMRGMNGDELARRIKAKYPETPIMMLTGYYDQPIGPENPVSAVFHKPDGVSELREALVHSPVA